MFQLAYPAGEAGNLGQTVLERTAALLTHNSQLPFHHTAAAQDLRCTMITYNFPMYTRNSTQRMPLCCPAAGGEFGILEGRTAALIHPAVMGGLFVASVYAGWLGWQYRRSRTLVDDIKALKAQLPKPAAEGEPAPASPLTAQIAELEKVSAGGF